MWRAWAPRHPEVLGSTGTGLRERRLITIWTSCPLPSCQKAQTFGSPAISLGCLPTPECLNFLRALSFAARDWHRSCKGNGWFSHWPAFGICTLTFMQERIWRLKMCFWTQGYISRSNRRRNTLQRNVFLFFEKEWPHVPGAPGKSKAISFLRTVLLTYSVTFEKYHILSWYFLPVHIMEIKILPTSWKCHRLLYKDCCEYRTWGSLKVSL